MRVPVNASIHTFTRTYNSSRRVVVRVYGCVCVCVYWCAPPCDTRRLAGWLLSPKPYTQSTPPCLYPFQKAPPFTSTSLQQQQQQQGLCSLLPSIFINLFSLMQWGGPRPTLSWYYSRPIASKHKNYNPFTGCVTRKNILQSNSNIISLVCSCKNAKIAYYTIFGILYR